MGSERSLFGHLDPQIFPGSLVYTFEVRLLAGTQAGKEKIRKRSSLNLGLIVASPRVQGNVCLPRFLHTEPHHDDAWPAVECFFSKSMWDVRIA